jgi:hypothetical protein
MQQVMGPGIGEAMAAAESKLFPMLAFRHVYVEAGG